MADPRVELPIFELPVVILPGEVLPLHIFEDRYKRMVGHCLEAARAVRDRVPRRRRRARRIGCTARITEVLERFEDGRMNIVVRRRAPVQGARALRGRVPGGRDRALTRPRTPRDDDAAAADTREAFAELVERVAGDPPEADELEDAGRLRDRRPGRAAARDQAGAARDPRRAGADARCWATPCERCSPPSRALGRSPSARR